MNVRLAPQEVRFRVTREEFGQLHAGRAVAMSVSLPGQHAFKASIAPDRFGMWRLDSDPTGMWLALPKSSLDPFAEGVPSTEGIEQRFELANGGFVTVVFEVDVRS